MAKNKFTLSQIINAWFRAYGEDMTTEYPGFVQKLTEQDALNEELEGLKKYVGE